MRPTLHANTRDKQEDGDSGLQAPSIQHTQTCCVPCFLFAFCLVRWSSHWFLHASRGHSHSEQDSSNDFCLVEIYRRKIRDPEREINSDHKHKGAGQSVYLLPLPSPVPHTRGVKRLAFKALGIGGHSLLLQSWGIIETWASNQEGRSKKSDNTCQLLFTDGRWLRMSGVPSSPPHK